MNLEILISTSFTRLEQAVKLATKAHKKNTSLKFLIVCQLFDKPIDVKTKDEESEWLKVIYSTTKGLAKSRNIALKHATEKYVWILDDDVEIKVEAIEPIITKFEESNADFITAQYEIENGVTFKKYMAEQENHNLMSIMKVSSIEIFLKKSSFIESGILFDERFGLGANYKSGEENIVLSDALNHGLVGQYLPISTSIHPAITSGNRFDEPITISSKGALIKRVFGVKGFMLLIPFYFKKLLQGHFNEIGWFNALKFIINGFVRFKS